MREEKEGDREGGGGGRGKEGGACLDGENARGFVLPASIHLQ